MAEFPAAILSQYFAAKCLILKIIVIFVMRAMPLTRICFAYSQTLTVPNLYLVLSIFATASTDISER